MTDLEYFPRRGNPEGLLLVNLMAAFPWPLNPDSCFIDRPACDFQEWIFVPKFSSTLKSLSGDTVKLIAS